MPVPVLELPLPFVSCGIGTVRRSKVLNGSVFHRNLERASGVLRSIVDGLERLRLVCGASIAFGTST